MVDVGTTTEDLERFLAEHHLVGAGLRREGTAPPRKGNLAAHWSWEGIYNGLMQSGKIVTIGSMSSLFGFDVASIYAAAKGGVVQLTRSLAMAWAKDNIQVNAVLPGWIDTELTRDARRQVSGLNERILNRTPAGRWGTPADLAGIAVFLGGPASDFVTGAAIPIDGGFSAEF